MSPIRVRSYQQKYEPFPKDDLDPARGCILSVLTVADLIIWLWVAVQWARYLG